MKKKISISVLVLVAVIAGMGFLFRDEIKKWFLQPTASTIETGVGNVQQSTQTTIDSENLDTPWGLAFLPGGDYLVTERSGNLVRVGQNGQTFQIQGVIETSEGGLLGVAVHPNFESNNLIYLYLTEQSGQGLVNRIDQFELRDDTVTKVKTLIEDIPGAQIHDGGRLAFGPDNLLYATTGDAGVSDNAQDTDSLAGKILRMTDQGEIPGDNPFGNYVYSYGHRNPQGIAWDDDERLWSTEHGPSGTESGNDELNLIESGGNYGWPVIRGQETAEGMISPVAESGAEETWAPASLTFADGSLFFAGLRGQTLYEAKINGDSVELKAHLREAFGRLRTVVAHDDALYLSTSNRDGRGQPVDSDDRIIEIPLGLFR